MLSPCPLGPWALCALFCALFCAAGVLARPALPDPVPFTIIPGEGLPSLESLNLTMRDLLDPRFAAGPWTHRPASRLSATAMVLDGAMPQRRPDDVHSAFPPLADLLRPTKTAAGRVAVNTSCQGDWGEVSAAQACINYLSALGTQACVAAPSATFCVATDDVATQVVGFSFVQSGSGIVSSDCAAVACAVGTLIDTCSQINPGGCEPIGGFTAACGSSDLGVWVGGRIGDPWC